MIPEFKRPELEDKELIDYYFAQAPSRSCERTFANVYLWSRQYKVKYAILHNALVFRDEGDGHTYAYPVGKPEAVKAALEELMKICEDEDCEFGLYCVTPENFSQMEEWYPGQFRIEYDRDQADYIYETEKLATLAGKKLHGKRNHINKFKQLYPDWSYESLSDENVEACFQMALKWRNSNGCNDDSEKNAEMCVSLNSLRLYKELGFKGGVLRNGEKIVAFTVGEELCKDTFVVHIEKAFADVQGAYPMINQQFATERLCISMAGKIHDRFGSKFYCAHYFLHFNIIILAVTGNSKVDIDLCAEHASDTFRVQAGVVFVCTDGNLTFCYELHHFFYRHVFLFCNGFDLWCYDAFSCGIHLSCILSHKFPPVYVKFKSV